MDEKTQWHRRLDQTLDRLASQFRTDLYDNVVVPVVHDWFSSWDSLAELNERIRSTLAEQWPLVERGVRGNLTEFESYLKAKLQSAAGKGPRGDLDVTLAQEQISARIADVMGLILTVVGAILAGGAGTALVVSGPIGWIVGLVGSGLIYALGLRGVVKRRIETRIHNLRLPPYLKSRAKSKVATELSLNARKFEEQIYTLLKEQCQPLYKAIQEINV